MQKNIYLTLIILLVLMLTANTALSVLADSAVLTNLTLSTADFEIQGPLTILENKPINVENFVPGQWSDYGRLRIVNNTEHPVNFYTYVSNTDGNVCPELNIMLEISDNGEEGWELVYEGELEEIRGNNDRIPLTINEDFSKDSIFLRQRVQLDESADKNDQGKECLWNEVFRLENDAEDIKDEYILSRHTMSVFYWIPPKTEVKEPSKNKEYEVGEEIKIKWKVKSATHDQDDEMKIDIELFEDSGATFLMDIANDLENKGQYKWLPPVDLLGDDFRIKILAEDGKGLTSENISEEDFSIVIED